MASRSPRRQTTDAPPCVHLAIVDRPTAKRLLSGQKVVETRFSRSRRAPFGRVRGGDILIFKVCGGKMLCTSAVRRVRHFDRLDSGRIEQIRRRYGRLICAPDAYWRSRRDRCYGSLMWLGRPGPPPESFRPPRQYGNGWVVLGRAEDLGFNRQRLGSRGRFGILRDSPVSPGSRKLKEQA